MSAYGSIERPELLDTLPCKLWRLISTPPDSPNRDYVTTHHLTRSSAHRLTGLLEHLTVVFADEVDSGLTYPQEGDINQSSFESYFFAADVIVGIIGGTPRADRAEAEIELDIDMARAGRPWDQCVAGFYYIKPNYPGRSSHICNAGFVVPPNHRGAGYGSLLAKSYVYYARKLGYQASVFNLVYVNNIASIKLWERLNFSKAGLIPRAGRLKRKDGKGEEYVDAWVFYKNLMEN